MTQNILSDAVIAAMSAAERRDLIRRLERPLAEAFPQPGGFERVRRVRLGLMVTGTVVLIPWIIYLGYTLPDTYVAQNWLATWVGFDGLLVVFMAATAILGFLRRQILALTGFTTGVLLICDAWFDMMTARSDDMWLSIVTAVFGALPLAAILIGGTLRIMHVKAIRLWQLDPGTPLWRLPLLP